MTPCCWSVVSYDILKFAFEILIWKRNMRASFKMVGKQEAPIRYLHLNVRAQFNGAWKNSILCLIASHFHALFSKYWKIISHIFWEQMEKRKIVGWLRLRKWGARVPINECLMHLSFNCKYFRFVDFTFPWFKIVGLEIIAYEKELHFVLFRFSVAKVRTQTC